MRFLWHCAIAVAALSPVSFFPTQTFAAEKAPAIVDVHLEAALHQFMGGAQARNSTADDSHLISHPPPVLLRNGEALRPRSP